MPGLGEVLDNSTLAQRTGTDRSTTHHHGTMDNPPNPQHQKGGDGTDSGSDTHHGRFASDDAQHDRHTTDLTKAKTCASKGGTTDCLETRGKKRAEGIVGGYKRPVFARYHKEGTNPHRQTPNKNGDLRGDEEGDAKAKATNDSRGGI